MILAELVPQIPGAHLFGPGDLEVNRPRYDHRKVSPGDLFCAIVGKVTDGNDYAQQALDAGASAILTSNANLSASAPRIIVNNDRMGMAYAARALYGDPTTKLRLIGLTGTNGKTTSTHILQSILRVHGSRAARIGTIGWEFEGRGEPLPRTTPEAPDLLEMLDALRSWGATDVAMEVTSIALVMQRVTGFTFAAGLFTNLTQDHLDLHGSMDQYFAAKKMFFQMLPEGAPAVANMDDPHGPKMLDDIGAATTGFGFSAKTDIRGKILSESAKGMRIKVAGKYGTFEVASPYMGRFNAENVLGCISLALALGVEVDAIQEGVSEAPQVRGRMEKLEVEGGVTAVVDYAHSPDALKRALEALRPMTSKRLIVVVGAGGDRDRGKRSKMGAIAAAHADVAIFTSDNPRSEPPEAIVREMAAGAKSGEWLAIVNRREAIASALEMSKAGDVVLIAGKGHETYQEVEGVQHHFDDREEVQKWRRALEC